MGINGTLYLDVAQCVDHLLSVSGNDIRIGMPLGSGNPVPLLNALYRRAKENPEISLTVFTALSLEKPTWSNDLERRFLEPFVARVWGGVPDIEFLLDIRKGALPPNVYAHELFFNAGTYQHPTAARFRPWQCGSQELSEATFRSLTQYRTARPRGRVARQPYREPK